MADDERAEAQPYRNHPGFSIGPNELHIRNLEDLAKNATFHRAYSQVSLCGPS